jgi:acetyl esterase/lipase
MSVEMKKINSPCGSWRSPITAELIAQATIGFGTIKVDGGNCYWIETRPTEGGRHVIVKQTPDGTIQDITPTGFNARTRVHEYGGGAYTAYDGTVYFSNFEDQKIYRQEQGKSPQPLTNRESLRFAEPLIDPIHSRVIAVCEDHTAPGEAVNSIAEINLTTGDVRTLISGYDFYSNPKLNRDGSKLSCLAWNHPQMPWDGTELLVATLDENGSVIAVNKIAGGKDESIFQPEWSPNGDLYFVSDRSNWWNLYCYHEGETRAVCPKKFEFGRAQWHFGYSIYAFESADSIIVTYSCEASWRIGRIDLQTGELDEFSLPFTDVWWLNIIGEGRVIFRGGSPTLPQAIVELNLRTLDWRIIRTSTSLSFDLEWISVPEAIAFATKDGESAHALYYPPKSKTFQSDGEQPPLLVKCHGGPTGTVSSLLNFEYQYWTSRGVAIVDVNYRGSTGYGRAYRDKLRGNWGIVDVDDCAAAALHLAAAGKADKNKLMITGGSAGGFTTLCALTFSDKFRTGTSYYGVSDLELLGLETHKFESRYLRGLVAPYPERRDIYVARSPLHHADKLLRPVCLFQGLEDKVVPVNQAEKMVESLRRNAVPFAYVAFPNEQHGFRRAETIRRCLDAELYFYSCILGFKLAEDIEPLEIENFKS